MFPLLLPSSSEFRRSSLRGDVRGSRSHGGMLIAPAIFLPIFLCETEPGDARDAR